MILFRRITVAMFTAMLMGCSYPSTEQNHTFTVVAEVDTPEGIKTGRSTIRIRRVDYENNNWCGWMCPGPPTIIDVDGEAVVVDMPEQQQLFVLLTSRRNGNWIANNSGQIEQAAENPKFVELSCRKPNDGSNLFAELDLDGNGCWDMPVNVEVPYFVKFADKEKFSSIAEVDPFDLAKSFGRGVKLKELRLETGGDEISKILEELPWVARLVESENYSLILKDEKNAPPFPNGIGQMSFKQEPK